MPNVTINGTSSTLSDITVNQVDDPLVISSNVTEVTDHPGATLLHVVAEDVLPGRVVISTFTGESVFTGRAAGGSAASPQPTPNGQPIVGLVAMGRGTTGWSLSARATMVMVAAEDWTDAAQGTFINWSTTKIGTAQPGIRMRLHDDGELTVGSTSVNGTEKLQVTGGLLADAVRSPALAASPSYADDAAAAADGVPIGGFYRNGSAVMCRVT